MKKSDIRKIINESCNPDKQNLDEAYIAMPKKYSLKTEMLLEKTKGAHKDLYEAYILSLNDVNAQLDVVSKSSSESNNSQYRSLKKDETYLLNAVYLHELFFANISDAYSEITKDSYTHLRLTRDFGTFEDWQRDFTACARAARDGGWVVTAYSTFRKSYVNFIIDGDDAGVLVGCYPIIVLDMWEHSRRDYLNNKRDYITAMMRELDWNVIEDRVRRADAIAGCVQ